MTNNDTPVDLTVLDHAPTGWDYTTLPPARMPYAGVDIETAAQHVRGIVESAITNQPRSLQKRIGPSELGTPCDHCLAAKLAGWPTGERGVAWLPFVGTAVHAAFEEQITSHEARRNAPHTTGTRWLTEQRVTVGQIGGQDITGSTDLFDTAAGATFDWKIVGESILRSARRNGPSPTYRAQAHLYGRGWVAAGHHVTTVAIWYLPRNDMRGFDGGHLWHEPYDEQVALAALDRANRIHTNLTALESISTQARDAWITALPRDPHCFDCARFPDRPAGTAAPGHTPGHELDGLIPTPAA